MYGDRYRDTMDKGAGESSISYTEVMFHCESPPSLVDHLSIGSCPVGPSFCCHQRAVLNIWDTPELVMESGEVQMALIVWPLTAGNLQ